MCGRYSLTTPSEALRQLFRFPEQPNLPPRYNVAPTQDVAAVRLGDDGRRHFVALRWGLVPSWAKDTRIGASMINARAEGLAEKPAFRAAFRARRCLVLADGFYEWQKREDGKQPYRFTLADGGPFGFAGLWERWLDAGDGTPVESCTIVTTEANDLVRPVHDRMPVILLPGDFDAWLDPARPPRDALHLLRPFPTPALRAYPVSTLVNNVRNDQPACVAPCAEVDLAEVIQRSLVDSQAAGLDHLTQTERAVRAAREARPDLEAPAALSAVRLAQRSGGTAGSGPS